MLLAERIKEKKGKCENISKENRVIIEGMNLLKTYETDSEITSRWNCPTGRSCSISNVRLICNKCDKPTSVNTG